MPANTAPIFTLTPNNGGGAATAANTSSSGSGTVGTDIFKVFTAGANGSWLGRIRFQAVSSAAATATTATVARIFISSVGSGTTAVTDTFCVGEVNLAVVTAAHSTTSTNFVEFPLNFALPTGWFVHITNHAAPATNTRWQATLLGSGDF